NGSLISDQIAKYLFKNKVAIGVSLDGKPKVNDKLRLTRDGKGATEQILQGLEVLKRNNIACGIT
ncbi:MAG: radical SAM protein, partial [Phascolarctobacterium sp.]|nr:radical SAM protein [Phascolarctobacterium sp.]